MAAQQVVSLNTSTPQLEAPQAGSTYTFPRAITGTFALGVAGSSLGAMSFSGNTSGTVTVQSAAAAGTWTFTLPTSGGTNTYALLTNGSGVTSWGQIAIGSAVSGLGTNVATALAVNVGSAGAFVTFNGALGTPSSGTLTNATGLPIGTGVAGLGTNVATALAVNVGSAGAFVTFNGAGGTPSSITLTNGTSLPISTGVSGLGTNVATALAVNVGSAGAFTTNNAANTFTASQTFNAATSSIYLGANGGNLGVVTLYGNTSGSVTLKPAAAAGTGTVFQLPADNGTSGYVLQTNGSGVTSWVASAGGSPGGSDTQVQFNDGGAFGGDSGLTFNKTTNALTAGSVNTDSLIINPASASADLIYAGINGTDYFYVDSGGTVNFGNNAGWGYFSSGNGRMTFVNRVDANSGVGLGASADVILTRVAAAILGVRDGAGTGGASISLVEQTAPSAPSANGVYIYAEDNGSGKTRLMALFPSGAAQQLAVEP